MVTVNDAEEPTLQVALFALVIAGAWFTLNVKLCDAFPALSLALMVIGYVPPLPAAGVPLNVPVPLPLSTKATPLGSAPVSVKAGVGKPVVVTEKVPAVPTINVVPLALEITGPVFSGFTVRVKAWVVGAPTPLLAVKVME
jgi:hypothetical protein